MAPKPIHPPEETPRPLQRGQESLADAVRATGIPTERGVARDTAFAAFGLPKGSRTVRSMAPPARRYWPSANSQHAPSRPQGTKKSPR
jgi:hypothetical protein